MDRLILILLGIVVFSAGLTYILWRVWPRVKFVKYLPALLYFLAVVYYLYLYLFKATHVGFQDLANAIFSMLSLVGLATGLVTCFIIDLILPRYK